MLDAYTRFLRRHDNWAVLFGVLTWLGTWAVIVAALTVVLSLPIMNATIPGAVYIGWALVALVVYAVLVSIFPNGTRGWHRTQYVVWSVIAGVALIGGYWYYQARSTSSCDETCEEAHLAIYDTRP